MNISNEELLHEKEYLKMTIEVIGSLIKPKIFKCKQARPKKF